MFLTPEFGPRVRFAAVLTDAPLEPDPLFEGKLCDRCMACVKDCSANAISATKSVKVHIAGRDVEWAEIDFEKCSLGFCGGTKETNPFMVTEEDEQAFNQKHDVHRGVKGANSYKLRPRYEYGRAIEGARGCMRACMVHLEEQGKMENQFQNPFRRREPWKL